MKKYLGYISAALVLIISLASPITSFAANNTTAGSSGLSITPRKNLIVNPGQTVNDKLSLSNLSKDAALRVDIRVIDFTFDGNSGIPKLYLSPNAPQTSWSIKPFITLPDTKVVNPGQTQTVNYSITVPKHQGAGSYYSAIVYSTGGTNKGNVNLSASGVTLMFVDVPGIVKEDMGLQKFGAYNGSTNSNGHYTYFNLTEPQRLAFDLKNNGNVAEAPSGSITLKNMWGKQVASIDKVNPNSSLAIIGQTRQFVTCIESTKQDLENQGYDNVGSGQCKDPNLAPGYYTASLDIYYGQNGNQTKEIQGTASFWYIPWWLLVIIAVVILLIIWAILAIKHKIRHARSARYKAGRH